MVTHPTLKRNQSRAVGRRGGMSIPVLSILFLALVSAAGGYWTWMKQAEIGGPTTNLVHTVHRDDFLLTVTEPGEIESSQDVEIRCEVKSMNSAGTTVLRLVPEGTHVSVGDFLVELDASGLKNDRTTQSIAVSRSEALMIEAKNVYDTAVIAKREYIDGTFLQERQTIESEIFVAEENLSRAKEYLTFSKKLAAKGHITSQQLEADAFAVEKSGKELEAANTKLRVLEDYTKAKMVAQLESEIRTAKAKWEAEKNSFALEKSKLDDIDDQISKCMITAPTAGTVMYAHESDRRGSEDFIVEPGAIVRERQIIIRLPNKEHMQVRTKINESLIKHVNVGAQAVIRPIGFGALALPGEVTRVSEYSEPTGWRKANVKEYRAYVRINGSHPQLRSGMTTSVTIECNYLPGVLQVPVESLYAHGDDAYCFVRDGDGWVAKKVKRGPTNESFFVIEEGLAENDVVAMNPRKLIDEVDLPNLPAQEKAESAEPETASPETSVAKGAAREEKKDATASHGA